MKTIIILCVALSVGTFLGFLLASILHVGADSESAPAKPEALAADPREIVAVYEARREMEKMGNEELKAWEKEQAKKGKRRRA